MNCISATGLKVMRQSQITCLQDLGSTELPSIIHLEDIGEDGDRVPSIGFQRAYYCLCSGLVVGCELC